MFLNLYKMRLANFLATLCILECCLLCGRRCFGCSIKVDQAYEWERILAANSAGDRVLSEPLCLMQEAYMFLRSHLYLQRPSDKKKELTLLFRKSCLYLAQFYQRQVFASFMIFFNILNKIVILEMKYYVVFNFSCLLIT